MHGLTRPAWPILMGSRQWLARRGQGDRTTGQLHVVVNRIQELKTRAGGKAANRPRKQDLPKPITVDLDERRRTTPELVARFGSIFGDLYGLTADLIISAASNG